MALNKPWSVHKDGGQKQKTKHFISGSHCSKQRYSLYELASYHPSLVLVILGPDVKAVALVVLRLRMFLDCSGSQASTRYVKRAWQKEPESGVSHERPWENASRRTYMKVSEKSGLMRSDRT